MTGCLSDCSAILLITSCKYVILCWEIFYRHTALWVNKQQQKLFERYSQPQKNAISELMPWDWNVIKFRVFSYKNKPRHWKIFKLNVFTFPLDETENKKTFFLSLLVIIIQSQNCVSAIKCLYQRDNQNDTVFIIRVSCKKMHIPFRQG